LFLIFNLGEKKKGGEIRVLLFNLDEKMFQTRFGRGIAKCTILQNIPSSFCAVFSLKLSKKLLTFGAGMVV